MTRRGSTWLAVMAVVVEVVVLACGPGPTVSPSTPGSPGAATPAGGPSATPGSANPTAPATHGPAVTAIVATRLAFTLPSPLSRAVAFPSGTGILVCGGLLASGATTRAILQVDLTSNAVSSAGRLAVAVHDAAGAQLPGRNLVIGGGNAVVVATIQTCAGDGGSSVIGRLPAPRADVSAVVTPAPDGTTEALVIGGGAGSTLEPDVLATEDGATVSRLTRLVDGVRYAAVAAVGGSIVVAGGFRAGSDVTAIQLIDLATGRIRVLGHLPIQMAHASAFAMDGLVVVAGGSHAGVPQRTIWGIDPSTGTVTKLGELPMAVADAATVVVGGVAYLVGGEGVAGTVASILELRPG